MASDAFDAVLAKPPIPDTYSHTEVTLRNDKDTKWVRREDFDWHMKQQAARLAAAHAAEKSAWFLRAREEAERCGQAEARAEAAERDAVAKCVEAVPASWLDPLLTGTDAVLRGSGPWGCPDIERLLSGVRKRIAAIATTEQAPERAGRE